MFIALFSLSTNKDYQTAKTLLLKDDWFFDSVFLAVQDSSIGDLVTH